LPPLAPVGDIRERLRAAREAGHTEVHFVGGEPTLHEGLSAWISAARHAGFDRIGVQTNGRRLAYASYARGLLGDGATNVDISLQGHNSALHDYHTGVADSFKQTVSGIRRAGEAGLKVAVTTVVTRSNMRHLAEIAAALRVLSVDRWRLRYVRKVGRAREDGSRLLARWDMAVPFMLEAAERATANGCVVVSSGLPTCIAPALRHHDEDEAGNRFGTVCDGCSARETCAGVDPGYLELYGQAELLAFNENDRPAVPDGRQSEAHDLPFVGGLGRTF
jgi:pyruvate-formate lyase-activating enzyme